jgi:hypothetical protein
MTEVAESPSRVASEAAARSLLPLLREYSPKLSDLSVRLAELWDVWRSSSTVRLRVGLEREPTSAEWKALADLFRNLRPAATELAREVSPLVEHADLDGTTRLELRLRLAELENAINSVDKMLTWVGR